MTTREWFDKETEKSIGHFTCEYNVREHTRDLLCPKCGHTAEYTESPTGDNQFGQPEAVAWFQCDHCDIMTTVWFT